MYRYIIFLVALIVCVPTLANAETVLRTGDKISVGSDQIVEGDYYVSVGPFGTTVMSGHVTEDMYAFGGNITVNGLIDKDFGAIAGIANINASVTDDVRIISGETIIDDNVGGDVFVISGILKILSTATIAGDVVFYGGDAEINGTIEGSVYGTAERMRIDAVVKGDVDVEAANGLTIGGRSDIAGDVRYTSLVDLNRAQEAVIGGDVTKIPGIQLDSRDTLRSLVTPFFISLFAALTLYLLFKNQLQYLFAIIEKSFVKAGFVGLATLLLCPLLSIMLFATVLGMLLGILGIGVTLVLYALGFALSSIFVGACLAKIVTKQMQISLQWILLGGVVFHVSILIPVLGPLVAIAVLSLTVGGCAIAIYNNIK